MVQTQLPKVIRQGGSRSPGSRRDGREPCQRVDRREPYLFPASACGHRRSRDRRSPSTRTLRGATGRAFDLVSPFGWTPPDHQLAVAERLLLTRPPLLPTGRRELLVCPECADLGCGYISAAVRREGGRYIWSEIGYETDYDPGGLSLFPMGSSSSPLLTWPGCWPVTSPG